MTDTPNRIRLLFAGFPSLILEGTRLRTGGAYDIDSLSADEPTLLPAVERLAPDVLMLDLLHTSSLQTIRRVREIRPSCQVIAISGIRQANVAKAVSEAIFSSGGSGLLYRFDTAEDLCVAIHDVLSGRRFISPAFKSSDRHTDDRLRPSGRLSALDELVFRLMVQEFPAHRIARALGLSVATVRLSIAHLKRQLRPRSNRTVHDCREAPVLAQECH